MINIIGHRGAAGHSLENTFNSFGIAKELGVDLIETDIQITKDGKLVIFHDNILNRISNGSGYLKDFSFAELSKLTLSDGSKIMQLEELCVFCKENGLKLFAELKGYNICKKAVSILKNYFSTEDFIIGSFFHKQIHEIKRENSNLQTCIIFEGYISGMLEYILSRDVDFISLGFESVTDNIVEELRKIQKNYIFWTLDQEVEIKKAISYSPWAIVTNYPERVRNIIDSID